jgi:hypothetical protein
MLLRAQSNKGAAPNSQLPTNRRGVAHHHQPTHRRTSIFFSHSGTLFWSWGYFSVGLSFQEDQCKASHGHTSPGTLLLTNLTRLLSRTGQINSRRPEKSPPTDSPIIDIASRYCEYRCFVPDSRARAFLTPSLRVQCSTLPGTAHLRPWGGATGPSAATSRPGSRAAGPPAAAVVHPGLAAPTIR